MKIASIINNQFTILNLLISSFCMQDSIIVKGIFDLADLVIQG